HFHPSGPAPFMSERLTRILIATFGLLAIAAFFVSGLERLPASTELGSGEGVLLDHAIRFADGQPVYAAPTLEFIPFAYMPGMPLVVAPMVRLFGPRLWEGRLVDLL